MNSNACTFVCPICRKEFNDIHSYAEHVNWHSEEDKKKKAEEERQRKADQKKLDTARLEKLHNMYEDAYAAYESAKEKYIEDYVELPNGLFDISNFLKDICPDGWGRWAH